MSRNIAAFLVELLVANDIDTVCGITGVHNMEFYRGMAAHGLRRGVRVKTTATLTGALRNALNCSVHTLIDVDAGSF